MHSMIPRRTFLRQTAAGSAGLLFTRICVDAARQLSPNEKLNLAVVGVAHQGGSDMSQLETENIVALCDVDETYLAAAAQKHPGAKTYTDFRRLLDQRDIDAVLVATPDHTHAVATVAALKSGRHVYCEKPLTRTVSECRAVMEAARKSKRVTQIGTQIHGGSNYRRVVELVRSGAIGPVREVHVWVDATYGQKSTPTAGTPLPEHLHFNLWLGPAAKRPYSPDYVPRNWRNWWAFGGGALADFGCHYMDLPHWTLELTAPSSVEIVEGPPVQAESVPPWLIVRYQYPARENNPPVALTWYHGGRQPGPEVLESKLAREWRSGVLFMGTKGQLLADYGRRMLLPQAQFEGFVPPTPFIPDSIGHYREWAQACKTGGPTTCNFEYSGTLTEAVLLGNVSYRAGRKLQWNSKKLRATDCPEANQFIQHQYRAGWKL
jgi:predicted dehydrogenase